MYTIFHSTHFVSQAAMGLALCKGVLIPIVIWKTQIIAYTLFLDIQYKAVVDDNEK